MIFFQVSPYLIILFNLLAKKVKTFFSGGFRIYYYLWFIVLDFIILIF